MSLEDAKKYSASAKSRFSVDAAIGQTIRAIDAIIEYLELEKVKEFQLSTTNRKE